MVKNIFLQYVRTIITIFTWIVCHERAQNIFVMILHFKKNNLIIILKIHVDTMKFWVLNSLFILNDV